MIRAENGQSAIVTLRRYCVPPTLNARDDFA
jgi:hypothetical protein